MWKMTYLRKKMGAGVSAAMLSGLVLAASPVTVLADTADSSTAANTVNTTTASTEAAGSGIDMSTDYPGITIKPGESTNFSLDFESLSGDSYDADLSIESIPEGWSGYFKSSSTEISMVHVDRLSKDSGSLATFSLTLPDEIEEGTYSVVLKADAGDDDVAELELKISVNAVASGQGSFSTEYPEQQGATGTSFSFDATIVNNRGIDQSYSLSSSAPTGWEVSFTPSSESTKVASMTVEGESSEGLTIGVVPPENVEKGVYTISCSAVSANETLSVDLSVEITGTYGVSLSTPSGRLSFDAYANDETAVTLSIENTGNVDLENLNLTSSVSSDWEVRFDESTIELLEAGATKEITAYVTPDANAITGDYVASLTVSNDEASSTASFRVSVKTRTSWGIVAVAIIVVLLAGLGFVFKKYGRR
ncbi:MAG: NEW3 domain-containing protein [Eubacteriales bacterium]|nr:NEW3 domain-containing protein [Eubacteriales bacterium]